MVETEHFKEWMKRNTLYSDAVIRDIASRIKRADRILPWYDDEVYEFYLNRNEQFLELKDDVRSQIRKATRLYRQFIKSN